ncbi:SDR family NAD(P)-dependent oxidoreductase [Actinomadura sp. NPDC023710]|uniref:SDR family NAD(P)-dependent oxidoreductase n=1 Tax=Actinomadura sp. NPDC023710 TaxID=3158219 RepID=UPI0033E0B91C
MFASLALHGRIDVLVNNAGIFGSQGAVDEVGDADWHEVLAANVTGSFLCAREAVRIMKTQRPRGGRIINNGSLSAHSRHAQGRCRPRPAPVVRPDERGRGVRAGWRSCTGWSPTA